MKAILSHTAANKSSKLATLTALATACAILLSAPANAAETDTAATAISVPSAMDSSKRVIRLARPNTAANAAQAVDAQPTGMQSAAQLNQNQPNRVPTSAAESQALQIMRPANTAAISGTTRVYEPGPMTAAGIELRSGQLANIPTPQVQISNVSFVPTVLIPQQRGTNNDKLDVSCVGRSHDLQCL